MAGDMQYEYRQNEALLLRSSINVDEFEIYRPKRNDWGEYDLDGAAETWAHGRKIEPEFIDDLMASLRELDEANRSNESLTTNELSSTPAATIAAAITWSFLEDCPMSAQAREDGLIVVSYAQVELEVADGQWFARCLFDANPPIPKIAVHNYEEVLDYVSRAITARFHYVEKRPPGHVKFHP